MTRATTFHLIDDDEVYLFITSKILEAISPNVKIQTFQDGELALNYFKGIEGNPSDFPDIILLDLNMPFLDGWGFLKELKTLYPGIEKRIKIYVVTSSDRDDDLSLASEFNELSGYYVKPIKKNELETLFREIVGSNLESN